jgi:hypothetical protein
MPVTSVIDTTTVHRQLLHWNAIQKNIKTENIKTFIFFIAQDPRFEPSELSKLKPSPAASLTFSVFSSLFTSNLSTLRNFFLTFPNTGTSESLFSQNSLMLPSISLSLSLSHSSS